MSTSLYFRASRPTPISPSERRSIDRLIEIYERGVRDEWDRRDWRSFDVSKTTDSGTIFEGSAQLSDASPGVMWAAVQHWTELL
jgi:hypothetical protein